MAFDHLGVATRRLKRTMLVGSISLFVTSTGLAEIINQPITYGLLSLKYPQELVQWSLVVLLGWASLEFAAGARVDYKSAGGTFLERSYIQEWEKFANAWNEPDSHAIVSMAGSRQKTNELLHIDFHAILKMDETRLKSFVIEMDESRRYLKKHLPKIAQNEQSRSRKEANTKFWVFDIAVPYLLVGVSIGTLIFDLNLPAIMDSLRDPAN